VTTYTKPALRERIKDRVTASSKGGKAGQWSARKAQLVAAEYERAGGGYKGAKSGAQKSLSKWTREDWGTGSGKPSSKTGERYLPKAAREALTPAELGSTNRAKREATKRGEQFSKQPAKIAKKTAKHR